MKKIILASAIVLLTSVAAFSQCDKKVKWTAAKAELLDESGNIVDTKQGDIVVTTDSKTITLVISEAPGEQLEGTIEELKCEWKEAFKEGKTSFKSTVNTSNGKTSPATFSIEGKEGRLIIHMQLERMNGRTVRIAVDKHEVI